jgi:hypothetical protein
MPITTQSIRDPQPTGALRGALQAYGSVIWYMPGDALPPEPAAEPDPPPTVSRRQLVLGLLRRGWLGTTLAEIEAAAAALIATLPQDTQEVARVEWATAGTFAADHPLLSAALAGPPLSLTPDQVREFFVLCAGFE